MDDRNKPTARSENFRTVRETLGRTQPQLARALGISTRAVQSYEQGWRVIPGRVMIQLLMLLAIQKKATAAEAPCWEIRPCDPDKRETCPAFTVGHGQFCWFLAHKTCSPQRITPDNPIPCMSCPVIQNILNRPDRKDTP